MTEEFARKEKLRLSLMWLYYNWDSQNDLKTHMMMSKSKRIYSERGLL